MLRNQLGLICKKTDSPVIVWDEYRSVYTIQVKGEDQGRVIGKNGKVVWALDFLVRHSSSFLLNRTAAIEVLEPEVRVARKTNAPFKPNDKWDDKKFGKMVEATLSNLFEEDTAHHQITKDGSEGDVHLELEAYQYDRLEGQEFEDSLTTIIHAAGMAQGVKLDVKFSWN